MYKRQTGAYDGFLAFASDDDAILTIADGYAGEYFEKPDEDALDSVCEFTNCINGLYAVSYTHLDVYKRQETCLRSRCSFGTKKFHMGKHMIQILSLIHILPVFVPIPIPI